MTQKTELLTPEAIEFISKKVSEIHHGSVNIEVNADKPHMVTIHVIQNERFPAPSHFG